jgi:hypothetical protein
MSRGPADKAHPRPKGAVSRPEMDFSCPVPPRPGTLIRIVRGAWVFAGLPTVIVSAILIAAGRDAGLASFMFWLAVVWIILIRYVEVSCILEGGARPSPKVLRRWHKFSAVLATAAAGLYALARAAASWGRP